MKSKHLASFFIGVFIGFLFINYMTSFPEDFILSPYQSYTYQNIKFYDDVNDTRIIDLETYMISFKVQSYWQTSVFTPYSGGSPLPYLVKISIINKLDEVQWLDASDEPSKVYLYHDDELYCQLASLDMPSIEGTGLFLAPKGRCEIRYLWHGKYSREYLPDDEYEMRCLSNVGGEEYFFDQIFFSVETERVKVWNTVS